MKCLVFVLRSVNSMYEWSKQTHGITNDNLQQFRINYHLNIGRRQLPHTTPAHQLQPLKAKYLAVSRVVSFICEVRHE